MRISDWSSDVCSSDLTVQIRDSFLESLLYDPSDQAIPDARRNATPDSTGPAVSCRCKGPTGCLPRADTAFAATSPTNRSEERRVGKEYVNTCRSRWSLCH